ncbi:MAG TPA: hypothetical protein VGA56_00515 [Opitutaceae bacterium]
MRVLHLSEGRHCAIAVSSLIVTVLVAGCATAPAHTTSRIHATTPARMGEITVTAALPADITLNSLGAGGVAERRDDWTEMARAHARNTLKSIRPGRIVYAGDLETREELADEIAEVEALFQLIDLNLLLTYSPLQMVPPTAITRFDYSVGSIDRILDTAGADALLIVRGVDDIFAADRKALAVAAFILSAAAGAGYNMSSGEAHLSAALIGRDGTLLWYDWLGEGAIGDMRKPESVQATLTRLLRSMPGPTGKTGKGSG